MEEAGLAELAGVVGAGGAALVLLAGRRLTLLAGFGLLAAAEGLLALAMAGTDVLENLAKPVLVAAGVLGLVLVGLAAIVFVRWPGLTIPALVAAAPFRLPLDFDRDHRFLFAVAEGGKLGRLIPLYAVLAASAAAFLYRALRHNQIPTPPRVIALPTAAFLAFAAVSLLWTRDLDAGGNLLAFFLLPFAALIAVVARSPLPAWLPKALAAIAVGLATVFALVGLWQEYTKELLFYGPQLAVANAYSPFFRVTSLFTDPSLYGRHVVLGIAVLIVLIWAGRIHLAIAAALLAVMFSGLYFSYSQSSWAALFVVAAAVTVVAGDRNARRAVAVGTAVAVLVAGALVAVQARDKSIREVTSGRWQRAALTIDVIEEQPLVGVGLGAQPKVSRELGAGNDARQARFVSHTTPLTIAAELGLVGLALYALLLLAIARVLLTVRASWPWLALALAAVLLALFVHALAYSGFVEDPITWLAIGVGAAYLTVPAPVREAARERTEATIRGARPVTSK